MATILLVDDDPLQAYVRKSVLDTRFPHVHRVQNAAEAFCLVEQPMFASSLGLVISGSHLAGISGPEFVAELRARMPYLPVMVLGSGKDTPADYLSDHVRFLPVPVESDEMLRQASQMLALHKASAA